LLLQWSHCWVLVVAVRVARRGPWSRFPGAANWMAIRCPLVGSASGALTR